MATENQRLGAAFLGAALGLNPPPPFHRQPTQADAKRAVRDSLARIRAVVEAGVMHAARQDRPSLEAFAAAVEAMTNDDRRLLGMET